MAGPGVNFFQRLFGRTPPIAPPAAPVLEEQQGWFMVENRLPYPVWERIGGWIEDNVAPADCGAAWDQAVRLWAAKFPVLGGARIMLAESPAFLLLTTLEAPARRWALETLETAHRAITGALGELAWTDRPGKRAVFLLPERLYMLYVAAYYDSDYMGRSAGVFLNGRGYPHIAATMPAGEYAEYSVRRTLAHELTHFALGALPLPRWLDESLAMHFEDQLGGGELPLADRLGCVFEAVSTSALMREFCGWWTEDRMQGFWRGDLWNSEDDEQSLCYEMSRMLFRVLRQPVEKAPLRFRAFIRAADAADAGEAAAREHLGVPLGELASEILGPGDWAPRPFR